MSGHRLPRSNGKKCQDIGYPMYSITVILMRKALVAIGIQMCGQVRHRDKPATHGSQLRSWSSHKHRRGLWIPRIFLRRCRAFCHSL